jgi:hypothetical protein
MIRIAVLSANLGNFDTTIPNVEQKLPPDVEVTYHTWTDKDFPPIVGYTPRFQYRIPKLFGFEMFPGYDYYLWMDASMHFINSETITWFLSLIKNAEFVVFKHPHRKTVESEVGYIEWKLSQRNMYMSRRYQNGLHRESLELFKKDSNWHDMDLFASTVFMYRNIPRIHDMMKTWWFYQSRYWSCDQVALPYALYKHEVSVYRIDKHVFRNEYISAGKKHAS